MSIKSSSLKIINSIANSSSKLLFNLKDKSPEIFVIAGIVGAIGSTVLACIATTKVKPVIDDTKKEVSEINRNKELTVINEDDARKQTALTYLKTGGKLIKLYAPSIILGSLSIAGILTSNNILRKRNVALAAAYTAVDTGFKEYRKNVVERFGEEVDHELRYNLKKQKVEEEVIDENGNKKIEKKTIDVIDPNKPISRFARVFDETNPCWEKHADYNKQFLLAKQNIANNMLVARGYLFLNEVYDMLGFDKTQEGQVIGWIYNPDDPFGPDYVDFGIFDIYGENIHSEAKRRFINEYERSILLDFNVGGHILNRISRW